MTVTIVNTSWKGRAGRFQADGTREYDGTLDVYTSDNSDDATTIRNAIGTSVFAAYPNDPWAFLDAVECLNDDQHPRVWHVYLHYTTRPIRRCIDIDQSPLDMPAEIVWPSFHEEEVYDTATFILLADENGQGVEVLEQPVLNSAGGQFLEAPTRHVTTKGIIVRRNVPFEDFDPQSWNEWEQTVNNADFIVGGKTILKGRAKIWERLAEPQVIGQGDACFHYVRETIVIHLTKKAWGWRDRILDQGLYEKDENWNRMPIRVFGELAAEPIPLDGAGAAQTPPFEAKYMTYVPYEERDFTDLDLPQNPDGT